MTPQEIIAIAGLCSFPVYVAYREVASGSKFAVAWGAIEISLLLLFIVIVLLTPGAAWPLWLYAASLSLSYWRLFHLRNSSDDSAPPLSVIAWVLGVALAVGIVFFGVCLNRYAFIRGNDEYKVQVYDKFTGEKRY